MIKREKMYTANNLMLLLKYLLKWMNFVFIESIHYLVFVFHYDNIRKNQVIVVFSPEIL